MCILKRAYYRLGTDLGENFTFMHQQNLKSVYVSERLHRCVWDLANQYVILHL